ncbi:hypothetical protein GALL_438360 [mine drainage metagenome]|uniref:Uncharacterized protein n=1 Tax=mine drainage metagenome TaxID=410659 RepID=A0A1J5PSQ4_9ZZZZ
MLLDEESSGNENRHLLAILHSLECGTHGDLRLAVSNVAADDAVHRVRLLHVGFYFLNSPELIWGFDESKGVFEFTLPRGVRGKSKARCASSGCIESDQLAGDLANGFPGSPFGFLPVCATHVVDGRRFTADVASD